MFSPGDAPPTGRFVRWPCRHRGQTAGRSTRTTPRSRR